MVIIREHKVIKKWKGVYQDMMDKGFILPEALKNDIEHKTIHCPIGKYSKVRTNFGISGKVTHKNHKVQVTHHINLSDSPPSCSNGCLRLYGKPCKEMVVYSKFVKLDIIDLLPNKYKLEYQRHLLGLSLPDNHPVLSIDNDSLDFYMTK